MALRKPLQGNAADVLSKLLTSAALISLPGAVKAGDLEELKKEIELLQERLPQLEATTVSDRQEPGSAVILRRGQGTLGDWKIDRASDVQMPADRGATISILPTAGLTEGVTEISVEGYVKGDFIADFDQSNLGTTFTNGAGNDANFQPDQLFSTTAGQTRLRLRGVTDTKLGRMRAFIETDFFSTCDDQKCNRLRHALGIWDATDSLSLAIGRFWRLGYDQISGIRLVDFGGSAGEPENSRVEQVRVTYTKGPVEFVFGVQSPNNSTAVNTEAAGIGTGTSKSFGTAAYVDTPGWPRLGGHLLYQASPDRRFFLGGEIQQHSMDVNAAGIAGPIPRANDKELGWISSAGTKYAINDRVTFTGRIAFSSGMNALIAGAGASTTINDTATAIRVNKAWGGFAGAGISLTDRLSYNVQWGFADPFDRAMRGNGISWSHVHTVHSNILWRPVSEVRLGCELMWSQKTNGKNFLASAAGEGRRRQERALRGQFAAWFFF
ncbi:MAG: hypothetical protein ACR2OR_01570 [Hyphomicrobiales bacterium]